MMVSQPKKKPPVVLIVVLCLLAICLVAGGTLFGLLSHKVRSIQNSADFSFDYTVTSTASQTPALYGVLQQVGATRGTVSGQYAAGKFQFALASQKDGQPFTRVYIDANETLYDAGQLYTYLRNEIVDAVPLAGLVLPGWNMGSYISQTQLASLLGVELSSVEMQDMTSLTLALGALQKVSPSGALDGYTYYQLPAGDTDLVCVVGLPMKELLAQTTPLHVLLTIPEHEVILSLSGTITASEGTVIAPSSRMSDTDVDTFVQLRQSLEKFADVLQSLVA